MSTTQNVEHHPDQKRFAVANEGRESKLTYSHRGQHTLALEHTFVPPEDRGQGIAEQLTRAALSYAEENDLKIIPACSYVRSFVDKHDEFSSLVAKQEEKDGQTDHGAHEHSANEHGHDHAHHEHTDEDSHSWLATYKPLLLTLAYLLGGVAIAGAAASNWAPMFLMSIFMGLFFVAFSFFKMLDLRGFAEAYSSYDLIAARSIGYGFVYPFIELTLGVAYLLQLWPVATNLVTLLVMIVGTIGVVNAVARGRDIQCGCLGTMFDLPMSTVTIVEDVSMALMAAGMLVMLL